MPVLRSPLFSGHYPIPAVVYPGLIFNFFAHVIIWLLLTSACWLFARLFAYALNLSTARTYTIGIIVWLLAIISLFMLNQYLFPRSLFADFTATLIPAMLNTVILYGLALIFLLASLIVLYGLIKYAVNHRAFAIALIIIIIAAAVNCYWLQQAPAVATFNQPNIIIIGVDSLRPDHLGFTGSSLNITPNIDKFLQKSTYFANASTTQGRTYPAWVSILTGQFPKQNGARFDLIDPRYVHLQDDLPKLLQKAGYQTVYATDEKRFANIDKSYGFDKTIGPAIGFNDFILGMFNDFPLSNLISNTRLGKWLFPYNYSNRADTIIYRPTTFTADVIHFLRQKRQKPLFLGIHFCLSHWPYSWAASAAKDFPPHTYQNVQTLYNTSVEAVDQQFQQFWQALEKYHLLNNTIVIVLSDHGESLAFPGDRLTAENKYIGGDIQKSPFANFIKQHSDLPLDQSTGHGTDVLSPSQYHIVLAFRLFGQKQKNIIAQRDFPVSLVDIKPTIAALLNMPMKPDNGISLVPYLFNDSLKPPATRALFMESGFAPDKIKTGKYTLNDLIDLAVTYYQINPKNGRVHIKDSKTASILKNKQRAIIYGKWLLAVYPVNGANIPVLVNLESKQWTDDLRSAFAQNSPLKNMLVLFNMQYKNEM